MILNMVLGLMQSILSFVLGLLPLPDVPAWLVELTETILGYMKTGMGTVSYTHLDVYKRQLPGFTDTGGAV